MCALVHTTKVFGVPCGGRFGCRSHTVIGAFASVSVWVCARACVCPCAAGYMRVCRAVERLQRVHAPVHSPGLSVIMTAVLLPEYACLAQVVRWNVVCGGLAAVPGKHDSCRNSAQGESARQSLARPVPPHKQQQRVHRSTPVGGWVANDCALCTERLKLHLTSAVQALLRSRVTACCCAALVGQTLGTSPEFDGDGAKSPAFVPQHLL